MKVEKLHKEKKNLNKFFCSLKELDNEIESVEKKNKLNNIKEEINTHFELIRKGNEVRVRNEKLKFIKQPTKVLLQEEIKQNKS